jgi:hypothetical protein
LNHDITDFDDGSGMNIITASLYGLGSIWSAVAVINNPEPSETIMHLVVRLMPSMMIGLAALIQAVVVAYKAYLAAKMAKKKAQDSD